MEPRADTRPEAVEGQPPELGELRPEPVDGQYASISDRGPSKISSSCTCRIIFVRSSRSVSSSSILFIATLMMSLAVPCTGMLIAIRSPEPRTWKFGDLISGI